MPEAHTLLLFALTALLFAASPGPNFIFVLSRSISHGRSDGLMSVLGIGTGALFHTLAAVLGLSALLATSALAFGTVKLLGAVYLIYLGVRVLLSAHELSVVPVGEVNRRAAYRQGLLTMMLNPKAAVYYLAVLPQFVDASRGTAPLQLLVFGTLQALAAVVVYTSVAFLAASLGVWLGRSVRARSTQKWLTGSTYIALGAGLALSGRSK